MTHFLKSGNTYKVFPGNAYVNCEDDNDVTYELQDEGRTLKVFVYKLHAPPLLS